MINVVTIFVLISLISASSSTITKIDTNQLHWVPGHDGYIPANAIQVGTQQGTKLYFARGIVNQGLYIGYIKEGQNTARISQNNVGHLVTHYQVLIGTMQNVKWVKNNNLILPKYTVKAGFESNLEPLFVGRAIQNQDKFPGQFGADWNGLKFPKNNVQITATSDFELLVYNTKILYQDYLAYDSDLLIFKQNQLFRGRSSDYENNDNDNDDDDGKVKALTAVTVIFTLIIIVMAVAIVFLICRLKAKRKMQKKQTSNTSTFENNYTVEDKPSEVDLYPVK